MAIARSNPFLAELSGMKNRLNRLFDQDDFWINDAYAGAMEWMPAVDIVETDRDITIKAELPGVEPKDVAISLENNVLTLKGQRESAKEVQKENYYRMERATGAFSRSFAIPVSIDGDKVTADFKNGLLTITLPKKESARGRTIEVNVA
jgi:HSP20 family protein